MQSQDRWKMERDERVEQSRAQSIRLVILSLPAEKELFFPPFIFEYSVRLSVQCQNGGGETLGCFSTYSKQGRACNQNVELDKSIGRKKMWPFLGGLCKTTGYPAAHPIKFDHTTHGPASRWRTRAFSFAVSAICIENNKTTAGMNREILNGFETYSAFQWIQWRIVK